ncbi:DNA replication/repair protein RecF [Zooshikella ganghwensis]|uniref:DNA replication and repair protein RecF n=1 Tax=Zooshikella ganghwensis TaxID=202772 RepID=A0A4P9VS30_9GAMM|nr:DNA replication/repair protein RecF [Zooshikella ganghwensis]RDH46425.1 DNA replication/repair protein RecF [Zooshikella ganghwensis]
MPIDHLQIAGVRNLKSVVIEPSPTINIISGINGSGKTSILESIHLLGLARSFRSAKIQPVIMHGENACTVFGRLENGNPLGIQRLVDGELLIKYAGKRLFSVADLASKLPLIVITPDTFQLLSGSPSLRRQFIDWGVFHVEHNFLTYWKNTRKVLKQRNNLLKNATITSPQVASWDITLVENANKVDQFRALYLNQLKEVFHQIVDKLINISDLSLSYYRGWDKEKDYSEILKLNFQKDKKFGFTSLGPHKADLKIKVGNKLATDVLSRGQQKIIVCALKIAQGFLYLKQIQRPCIFLIDDLASELDQHFRNNICQLLENSGAQVFITVIDTDSIINSWKDKSKVRLFHVEHGQVKEMQP